MNEKAYKTMKGSGIGNLVMGVILLVTGISMGVMLVVSGAKLLHSKSSLII